MNKLIYTIIVTYNGEKWIEKCINSIIKSSVNSIIIVIDNNSKDKTKEIIKNNFKSVQLIENTINLGFGKANNIGLKIAKENNSDYVFLLNQDAWIESDTIEKLINATTQNEEIGIIAPMNLIPDGSVIEPSFNTELNFDNCPDFLSDLYLKKTVNTYRVNKYINASCWLITSRCLKAIGGFDPLFSHYGEDVNYCMRARFHEFQIAISTQTKSFHAKDNNISDLNPIHSSINRVKQNYLNNYLLNKLTDLNLNFVNAFIEESIILTLLTLKYFFKFKFKLSFIYLSILIFNIMNGFKIYAHKNKTKVKSNSFID